MYVKIYKCPFFQTDQKYEQEFPIEANRLNLVWILFEDSTQEQFLTLRNKLKDQCLKVSLQIRNDCYKEFSFSKTEACNDYLVKNDTTIIVTLPPSGQRDVFLNFIPKSQNIQKQSKAELVIKPQGLSKSEGGKNMKSKIQLQACKYGICSMNTYLNKELLQFDKTLQVTGKTVQFIVKNDGECDSFFKVSVLNNVQQIQFVLEKSQQKTVKMILPEKECTLAVFSGPEITRQLFKSCTFGANNSFLLGQDFKSYFEGENETYQTTFKYRDIKHFFKNIQRKIVKIQVSSEPSFVTLNAEEDFSEFEITNHTKNQHIFTHEATTLQTKTKHTIDFEQSTQSHFKYNMQLEYFEQTDTSQLTSSEPNKSQQTIEFGQTKNKHTIKLDRETIHFPTVRKKNDSSVAKITLKNRTEKVGRYHINPLESPFENYHSDVEVKPHFYLSIPIRFKPTEDNMHCEVPVMLTNVETKDVLKANLVASSQYYS